MEVSCGGRYAEDDGAAKSTRVEVVAWPLPSGLALRARGGAEMEMAGGRQGNKGSLFIHLRLTRAILDSPKNKESGMITDKTSSVVS